MNSFIGGNWGTEEYASSNPFKAGEAFQMFIVAKPEGYMVYDIYHKANDLKIDKNIDLHCSLHFILSVVH